MGDENAITCTECYSVLKEIKTEVSVMAELYKSMNKTTAETHKASIAGNNKIMLGMLGIIGATLGKEFIGTPWYVHIGVYSALVSGIFLLSAAILFWRRINKNKIVVMISYGISVMYATSLRIYHYSSGTPLTMYEGIVQNILYTFVSISMVFAFWNSGFWNGCERRKKN